ncbi:DUF742 domain-containing protein [Streptomyces sp. XM4193]|uniref:DUF742 domain-containing protein n=1 Tax=Streptomyces sp. XM4193 TaxID=2929782 RepID=UPI001FF71CFF|nr:DUF742 domain-containing protein [Streptomyces sp. XM4193]MCK1797681.1 DUF742 domain-containing protein [Streptomyces sp. XM4193]
MTERWFDDAAGPVVRPYAMTRGRTRGASDEPLDLIALVLADDERPTAPAAAEPGESAEPGSEGAGGRMTRARAEERLQHEHRLVPEHLDILRLCREELISVAELAAALDLPVGVVRVLLEDLLEVELVRVTRPVPPAELPDESVLREVISGLRAL